MSSCPLRRTACPPQFPAGADTFLAMSILGNRVLRKEDPKFLTTGGTYVDDLPLPGAVYVTYVRATMAHANITVDTSEAVSMPGVVAIYTGEDVDLDPLPPAMPMINPAMSRPFLAKGTVRFVGEPGAAGVPEGKYPGPGARGASRWLRSSPTRSTKGRTRPSRSMSSTARCRRSSTPSRPSKLRTSC